MPFNHSTKYTSNYIDSLLTELQKKKKKKSIFPTIYNLPVSKLAGEIVLCAFFVCLKNWDISDLIHFLYCL